MGLRSGIARLGVGVALAAVSVAGGRGAGAAEPIKLRFAHTVSTEDTAHKAIVEFAKRVKDKTGGRAEIEIFPAA